MLQSRVEIVNEAGDVQFLFRKKNIYISVYEYFSFRFSVDAVVARYKHEHIVENLSLKEPVSRVSFFPLLCPTEPFACAEYLLTTNTSVLGVRRLSLLLPDLSRASPLVLQRQWESAWEKW